MLNALNADTVEATLAALAKGEEGVEESDIPADTSTNLIQESEESSGNDGEPYPAAIKALMASYGDSIAYRKFDEARKIIGELTDQDAGAAQHAVNKAREYFAQQLEILDADYLKSRGRLIDRIERLDTHLVHVEGVLNHVAWTTTSPAFDQETSAKKKGKGREQATDGPEDPQKVHGPLLENAEQGPGDAVSPEEVLEPAQTGSEEVRPLGPEADNDFEDTPWEGKSIKCDHSGNCTERFFIEEHFLTHLRDVQEHQDLRFASDLKQWTVQYLKIGRMKNEWRSLRKGYFEE
jgi:hypothetical protein